LPAFIGAGTILRILVRSGGPVLDRLGVLPPRWYLQEAVDAITRDDMPRVIGSLRVGRGKRTRRWELVRQQAIFRCRVLREGHERCLDRLRVLQSGPFRGRIRTASLDEAMGLHQRGIDILRRHEASLQSLILSSPDGTP
jgi:hypothetical protein